MPGSDFTACAFATAAFGIVQVTDGCFMYEVEYRDKVTTPEWAVRLVPACGSIAISMAVSQPPMLLAAL
jgi:hypothetical protein